MKPTGSKSNDILKHLQTTGSITSMEAFNLYKVTRLSAIIFNLKKKGYIIKSTIEEYLDKYGRSCRFVRYTYKGTINEE